MIGKGQTGERGMALLEVRNLTKYFGGLAALDGLGFDIHEGEILGLIGPNGAGKTTVFNMITGTLRHTHGEILFLGTKITGLKPHQIAQQGAIRTFQVTTLFGEMTVIQNVILGTHQKSKIGFLGALWNTRLTRSEEKHSKEEAQKILGFMGLSDVENELAKNLPHGHQRRLELAIALAANPKLLLMDEPLTGMNHEEVRDMLKRVARIREEGRTILLVEHNMKAVTSICDRIIVLSFGKKIAEGPPQEIIQNEKVIEAYLGAET
jgi:branched-chain amino acid transport system ATP-binding protein